MFGIFHSMILIILMTIVLNMVLTGNERLIHQQLQPFISCCKWFYNLLNCKCLRRALPLTILYKRYQILWRQCGQHAKEENPVYAFTSSPFRWNVTNKTWASDSFRPCFVNGQFWPQRHMEFSYLYILENIFFLHDDLLHVAQGTKFESWQFQLLQW